MIHRPIQETYNDHADTITTLRSKSPPTSLHYQGLALLRMRTRKEDGRTLSVGMSEIQ